MSEARSITNMIGNGIACVVVGRCVGELDKARLTGTLTAKHDIIADLEADLEKVEEKLEDELSSAVEETALLRAKGLND